MVIRYTMELFTTAMYAYGQKNTIIDGGVVYHQITYSRLQ